METFPGTDANALQRSEDYQHLKGRLHHFLIETVEREEVELGEWPEDQVHRFIQEKIDLFLADQRLAVNRREVEALTHDMVDELLGLGPIQPLVDDDEVNDILVNGHDAIYVEKRGRLVKTERRFIDDRHVHRIIQRILAPLGRRLDESTPMVDASLPDGGRVNAVIPPLALDGPALSIRKFRVEGLEMGDLMTFGTVSEEMSNFLRRAVEARMNLLVVGSSGAGKTTLLNALSSFVPHEERIITIEDAAELNLHHPHVVRLETRPPNLEGEGEITARELVRNSLRMRPERVIVGEVRGVEILDMLQAMGTGHDGSMGTLHANSPRDALHRLEMLAGFADYHGSEHTLRLQIASSIDLIVQVDRMRTGERRVTSIQEITGLSDNNYMMQELYSYTNGEFVRQTIRPHNVKLQQAEEGPPAGNPFPAGGFSRG